MFAKNNKKDLTVVFLNLVSLFTFGCLSPRKCRSFLKLKNFGNLIHLQNLEHWQSAPSAVTSRYYFQLNQNTRLNNINRDELLDLYGNYTISSNRYIVSTVCYSISSLPEHKLVE